MGQAGLPTFCQWLDRSAEFGICRELRWLPFTGSPLSRFPLWGKAGAGGFPPRRWHAVAPAKSAVTHRAASPPTRGAVAPLVHPPAGFTVQRWNLPLRTQLPLRKLLMRFFDLQAVIAERLLGSKRVRLRSMAIATGSQRSAIPRSARACVCPARRIRWYCCLLRSSKILLVRAQ